MVLVVGNRHLETTEQGFLCKLEDWDESVAVEIARSDGAVLGEEHWRIIRFIRHYYLEYRHLPNARLFVRAVKKEFGEGIGNSRYLHRLFPEGPLKYACKFAGLPKPPTCL
ncbi:MAG: TusE/DsrC/DsvC family sulfur relay protein [Gammaproteobacteria bacterium]